MKRTHQSSTVAASGSWLLGGVRLIVSGSAAFASTYLDRLNRDAVKLADDAGEGQDDKRRVHWESTVGAGRHESVAVQISHMPEKVLRERFALTNSDESRMRLATGGNDIFIRRVGPRHVQLLRSDSKDLSWDHALIAMAQVSTDHLPLHAAVWKCRGVGVAALGGASSGKTAALAAALDSGASWLADDMAAFGVSSGLANAGNRQIDVRRSLVKQSNVLGGTIRPIESCKLEFETGIRRVVRAGNRARWIQRAFPRLQRIGAEGRVRIACRPREQQVAIDRLVYAEPGNSFSLIEVDPLSVLDDVAKCLWRELSRLSEQRCSNGRRFGDEWFGKSDEGWEHVKSMTNRAFGETRCFVMRGAAGRSVSELAGLMRPLYQDSVALAGSDAPKTHSTCTHV